MTATASPVPGRLALAGAAAGVLLLLGRMPAHDPSAPPAPAPSRPLGAAVSLHRPPAEPPAAAEEPCGTGCSLGPHELPTVDDADIARLLRTFAAEPMSEESPALEALLFHGTAVRTYFAAGGIDPLDAARRAFLDRELARTRARVAFRIVDDLGAVRITMPERTVPLGVKRHLGAHTTGAFPVHEFNGTVYRVGLHHLWSRW